MSDSMRRCLRRIAIGLLCLSAGPVVAARTGEWREIKDPHYGETLFYFYQQKYFSALTQLMTAQHFGRFSHHIDEAELLRGGLLLSYGVHLEAGRIFERLIAEGAKPEIRDRAWYYLAKIRYQRGYLDKAEDALSRIEGKLPGELDDERHVLHALLLMQRGMFREAADILKTVSGGSVWARYGRYNLGVALVRAGESEGGMALLEQLGREPVQGEEQAALRDKANVALGYTQLQSGHADQAQASLERVRLTGLLTNKALLGMGWAHMAGNNPDRALVYWDELRRKAVIDAAVQESLLAAPYALGKLGAWRQSLQQYEEAGRSYEQEMTQIDQSVTAIRAGKMTDALLATDRDEEAGWLWKLEQLPDAPETRYLVQLMSGHDFQEALKNYRDLRFLIAQLDRWANDVSVYDDMLATRRAGFLEKLPVSLSASREHDASVHTAARDRLAAELERIMVEQDSVALADAKEQEQLARLARLQAAQDRAGVSADPESTERIRVLQGLLTWNLSQAYPQRLWDTKKSMQALDQALDDTRSWREALVRERDNLPRAFNAFEARIRDLVPRIRALQERARSLERAQAAHLGELAVAELTKQRERLATYLTQVRFAVAQIYDRSASESPEAP